MRQPTPTRFEGFPDADGSFFRALAIHQERTWFQEHKHEYEDGWVRPMTALLWEAREKLESSFPGRTLGEPKIFRIFRDVRFSKDKTPYKTHIGGYIPLGEVSGPEEGPAPLYLQLGTEAFAGGGAWMMSPDQLAAFRAGVLDDERGPALERILQKLERAGFSVESHDALKRVPRGFDPEHPRAELLKKKSLTVRFPEIPRDEITSRGLLTWVVKETKKVAPFVEWLAGE